MKKQYFSVSRDGNIHNLGEFENEDDAENHAATFVGSCEEEDSVYWGTREHFNEVFDRVAKLPPVGPNIPQACINHHAS